MPKASNKRKTNNTVTEAGSLEEIKSMSKVALNLQMLSIFTILLRYIYKLCLYVYDVNEDTACKYKCCLYLKSHKSML